MAARASMVRLDFSGDRYILIENDDLGGEPILRAAWSNGVSPNGSETSNAFPPGSWHSLEARIDAQLGSVTLLLDDKQFAAFQWRRQDSEGADAKPRRRADEGPLERQLPTVAFDTVVVTTE